MTPKDILLYFAERFELRTQNKMLVNWGRDTKLVKQVVAVYGPEKTLSLIDRFFQDPDDWVLEKGFTVPIFYSQCNSLVSREGQKNFYEALTRQFPSEDARLSAERGKVLEFNGGEGGVPSHVPASLRKIREDL